MVQLESGVPAQILDPLLPLGDVALAVELHLRSMELGDWLGGLWPVVSGVGLGWSGVGWRWLGFGVVAFLVGRLLGARLESGLFAELAELIPGLGWLLKLVTGIGGAASLPDVPLLVLLLWLGYELVLLGFVPPLD